MVSNKSVQSADHGPLGSGHLREDRLGALEREGGPVERVLAGEIRWLDRKVAQLREELLRRAGRLG